MVEVMEEEAFSPETITRWSDNCASQFKSGKVVADLIDIKDRVSPNLKSARFCFFESHEGKNLSDTIGSMAKGALSRATLRTLSGVGNNPEEVVLEVKERLLSNLKFIEGRVGSFSFCR